MSKKDRAKITRRNYFLESLCTQKCTYMHLNLSHQVSKIGKMSPIKCLDIFQKLFTYEQLAVIAENR